MSSRREELLRQRALIESHLAWLNREIEAEDGSTGAAEPTRPRRSAPAPTAPAVRIGAADTSSTSDAAEAAAAQILAQYQTDPVSTQQEIRRGCMTLLGVALALLGIIVILAYVFYRPKTAAPMPTAPHSIMR